MSDQWVVLNVGGTRYETYVSTLCSRPGMLASMFGGEVGLRTNEHNEYLIDRSGRVFESVLEYLRVGSVCVPVGVTLQQLDTEWGFFFGCAFPRPRGRMVDRLVVDRWKTEVAELYRASEPHVFKHLQAAVEANHEEMGVNLVPPGAASCDVRYSALDEQNLGSAFAPSGSNNVLNVLAFDGMGREFLRLLCHRYREEGFHVSMGERTDYFKMPSNAREDQKRLWFLVLSWKSVTPNLEERIEKIQQQVELLL